MLNVDDDKNLSSHVVLLALADEPLHYSLFFSPYFPRNFHKKESRYVGYVPVIR